MATTTSAVTTAPTAPARPRRSRSSPSMFTSSLAAASRFAARCSSAAGLVSSSSGSMRSFKTPHLILDPLALGVKSKLMPLPSMRKGGPPWSACAMGSEKSWLGSSSFSDEPLAHLATRPPATTPRVLRLDCRRCRPARSEAAVVAETAAAAARATPRSAVEPLVPSGTRNGGGAGALSSPATDAEAGAMRTSVPARPAGTKAVMMLPST
mmetsp:Transcript_30930/g.79424  ORF Transcript_30930/g.79424 Transcript_30930/m.79424 type:complete len:210 (+) Transcript_30930:323-952(+)